MSATITANWLTDAKEKLSCGGLNDFELKSLHIAFLYEGLLCFAEAHIPELSEDATIDNVITIRGIYARIECGNLLSETEYIWSLAEIARITTLQYCE